jgi:hypothetical protein
MKVLVLAATAALTLSVTAGSVQAATFYGPSAYTTVADSPFQAGDFTDYFYLEDVEDNAVNTLGLSATAHCISGFDCFVGAGITDSVGNGGNGQLGRSIWTNGLTELTFDAVALGGLPTFAGLVWTDGNNPITFEAFDHLGVSLGILNGNHADGTFAGTLADDRFYGVFAAGGISKLRISNPPGTEVDHIQYGRGLGDSVVPEPSTWALLITGFGFAGAMLRGRLARTGRRPLLSGA